MKCGALTWRESPIRGAEGVQSSSYRINRSDRAKGETRHRGLGRLPQRVARIEGCAALLVIGINDPRRHQTLVEVPYYTAVDRNTVPIHVRKSGMTWLTVLDRTTREPLNGSRRIPWSPAIVRDGFDVPDEIDAELAQ